MKHFLLICNRPVEGSNADTIIDHINALKKMPDWIVWEVDMLGNLPKHLNLDRFDAIGIHYTLHLSDPSDYYLGKKSLERITSFRGLKCVWMHDEYRRVQRVTDTLKKIGVDVIFSLASGDVLQALYPKKDLPQTKLVTVLAGYVPLQENEDAFIPIKDREIDVGYRARRPPFWLGTLGQEKIEIASKFTQARETRDLKTNISVEEGDRLYGDDWKKFLQNTKTVLCVESGSSIIDFSGEIEESVEAFCKENKNCSFKDVFDKFLRNRDSVLKINPVSPRVFEAAVYKTTIIAFKGEYSGILVPWRNYIPLEKDLSNIDEVISCVNDTSFLDKISENAWEDLIGKEQFSYLSFSKECSSLLLEEFERRKKITCKAYTKREFQKDINRSFVYLFFKYFSKRSQRILALPWARKILFRTWDLLPTFFKVFLRPALKLIAR